MVEVPDTILPAIGVAIPILLGFFYWHTTRKDKRSYETRSEERDAGDEERDKLETARKVKKELTDEAEKVESIRKSVAELVLKENQAYTNLKVDNSVNTMEHKMELYKIEIASKTGLYEQANESKFKANELIMQGLIAKMVDIAKINSDAIIKINETIDTLKKIFYELSGKVSRAERDINTKVDKE